MRIIALAITISYLLTSYKVYSAVSIVYNLRIAETTKRYPINHDYKGSYILPITGVRQVREKYNGIQQFIQAGLASAIYTANSFYIRADIAAAQICEKKKAISFSHTQLDDLLFSGGYSHKLNDRAVLTFSGLLGLPTHKDLSLERFQFGLGHVGLGAQADGSFAYSKNNSIRTATRFVHFYPRKSYQHHKRFVFSLGNLVDLLIAHHSSFGNHSFEAGYDTIFAFGATIRPKVNSVLINNDFIRSNVYSTYTYTFPFNKLTSSIALGVSYSFDHFPKTTSYKRIFTLWATCSVNY